MNCQNSHHLKRQQLHNYNHDLHLITKLQITHNFVGYWLVCIYNTLVQSAHVLTHCCSNNYHQYLHIWCQCTQGDSGSRGCHCSRNYGTYKCHCWSRAPQSNFHLRLWKYWDFSCSTLNIEISHAVHSKHGVVFFLLLLWNIAQCPHCKKVE